MIGGAEMVLLDILAAVRSSRPAWSLSVILTSDGPLQVEIERLGIKTIVLELPAQIALLGDSGQGAMALATRGSTAAIAALGYSRQLRRLLTELAPDVIHTNGMKAHLLGAWSAPRGLPMVWHMHDYLGSRALMARLLRMSTRPGLSVAAISQSVADDVQKTLGPQIPVQRIYNAVDLERFSPDQGDGSALDRASDLSDLPSGSIRVGLMATFARWKGQDVFLDAICQIPESLPCRFYIVGGPIYQSMGSQFTIDELKNRAKVLGIEQRVGFTGHIADPAAALGGLDVVVHASTRPEPFGRVIVEAMACGRALIAVHSGGAAELFEDGRDALASPGGDSQALAQNLIRLVGDGDLRRRLGLAGRETAESRFGSNRLTYQWPQLYETLSARPSHVLDADMISVRRSSSSPVVEH